MDIRFDILRIVALAAIILAHIPGIPGWLYQLRNFDVPLIVLVAGAAFMLSGSSSLPYASYVRHRVGRLIVPVWLFLFFLFSSVAVAGYVGLMEQSLSWWKVVDMFLLGEGYGYVWIFRVFLLIALSAPPLLALKKRIPSRAFAASMAVAYGTSFLLFMFRSRFALDPFLAVLLDDYVFVGVLYGCIHGMGILLPTLRPRAAFAASAAFLAVFFTFLVLRGEAHPSQWPFVSTQFDKHPPGPFYVSYALFVSFCLFGIVSLLPSLPSRLAAAVRKVSTLTLSVYLWHIPFVTAMKLGAAVEWHFAVRYIFVCVLSLGLAWLTDAALTTFRRPAPSAPVR